MKVESETLQMIWIIKLYMYVYIYIYINRIIGLNRVSKNRLEYY